MQKPLQFKLSQLVETGEDNEVYKYLKGLNVDVKRIRAAEPSHEFVIYLVEKLKRIHEYRTF